MAVEKLGIVGSGIMGSGVAEVAARAGLTVVLRSRKQETADALVAGLGSVDAVEDLATDLTPLARAVSSSGILPFPNPIGLPED